MNTNNYFIVILSLLLSAVGISSCVSEDVFDKSDRNTPTEIRVKGQLRTQIIYGNGTQESPDTAYVEMPETADLSNLTIEYITLPSLAKISPSIESVTNFVDPVLFTLTSESGKNIRYLLVVARYGGFNLQLDYNSMNQWYQQGTFKNGDGYYNIGNAGGSTPWANTNDVAAILDKAACVPSNFPDPSGHVVLTTLMNPTGGKTVGSGIASANIFTGAFRGNPKHFLDRDKQRDNVCFGVDYRHRPKSVSFEFKYQPGTMVEKWIPTTSGAIKWQGVDIPEEVDSMEVWVVLHKRIYDEVNPTNSKFYRIAAGGYISSETVGEWRRLTIPIHYGKPTTEFLNENPQAYRIRDIGLASSPRFVYQHNPIQDGTDPTKWDYTLYRIEEQWSSTPEIDIPTHLSLSFNSSAGGWEYKGAGKTPDGTREGSKLEIRNVIFEE
ncbi:MAG: PCMD domain-containing protein [Bacteroidales bacterium]